MDKEQIDIITEAVISKIKEKYLLVEKTYFLDSRTLGSIKKIDTETQVLMDLIVNVACEHFKILKSGLMDQHVGITPYNKVAWCVAYVSRRVTNKPIELKNIGTYFKKDHSTIIYWLKRCESKMAVNTEYGYSVQEVKKLVEQSLKNY